MLKYHFFQKVFFEFKFESPFALEVIMNFDFLFFNFTFQIVNEIFQFLLINEVFNP